MFAVGLVLNIVGDMAAEAVSTPIAERYGVAAMLRGLGFVQIALMVGVAAAGGAALWRYGIRTGSERPVRAAT